MKTLPNGPILLFDGVCNLCNSSVQWVLAHDVAAVFSFASLQSDDGQAILRTHGLDPAALDTVVLVEGTRHWTHSDAPLEVARRLGGLWSLFYVFKIVPPFLRNAMYRFIARNRYRWFGQREACMLPRPEWEARFL
jgi:predicted DCC family thiol-disulfide oxidoreductase YuxK